MKYDVAGKSKITIWVAGVGVVLAALVAAWWLTKESPSDAVEVSNVSVSVDGNSLDVFQGNEFPDGTFESSAPKLAGLSPYGDQVVVDPQDGKPKLIVFLAHWCPVCQAEVPSLVEWIGSGDTPIEIYGVATAVNPQKGNYPPGVWLKEEGWISPVLLDDESKTAASAYGLNAFPFFVAIDDKGRVVSRASGALTKEEFEGMLNSASTGVTYQVADAGAQTRAGS